MGSKEDSSTIGKVAGVGLGMVQKVGLDEEDWEVEGKSNRNFFLSLSSLNEVSP